MSKISPPMSSARRNAEALLNQSKKREASFKWEQERKYEAMMSKTTHLRELRLAKEAADNEAAALTPVSRPKALDVNPRGRTMNETFNPQAAAEKARDAYRKTATQFEE